MTRAGLSRVVRKIAPPKKIEVPRSNVAVLAKTEDQFRDYFYRVGKGSFEHGDFVTADSVYRLCSNMRHLDGIKFDSILRLDGWSVGPGSGERVSIQTKLRAMAGSSGILVEDA